MIPPLAEVGTAGAVLCLILFHVAAFGRVGLVAFGWSGRSVLVTMAVGGLIGLGCLGLEMLLLGHLGLLSKGVLLSSGGGAVLLLCWGWFRRGWCNRFSRRATYEFAPRRGEVILWALWLGMIGLILLSGLRPPGARDELDYHWASPVFWAAAGHWEASPYRLSNGPALAEMVYTFSAVFDSPIAAHWTHALAALLLVVAAAGLAGGCGGSRVAAAAGCLSIPVLVNQASIAYTDVFAAAFVVAAFAVLLSPKRARRELLLTGLLLAFAASVKSFTAVAVLPCVAIVIVQRSGGGARIGGEVLRLLLPGILLAGIWLEHTHHLTGSWLDRSGQYIARSADDPMLTSGAAAGRIPSARDLLFLPAVPAYATVFGQQEPYGGRIGLVAVPFLPVALWAMARLPKARRRRLTILLAAAAAYFLILAPFLIKTRFSLFVWVALVIAGAVGFEEVRRRLPGRRTLVLGLWILFNALVTVGMLDSSRVLVRDLRPDSDEQASRHTNVGTLPSDAI